MNELFGASTPTPWTPTTARYRANVLEWARLLTAKGGQPVLLVSSEPFTGGDAADVVARARRRSRTSCSRSTSTRRRCTGPGRSSAAGGCGRRCAARSPSSSPSASRRRSSASCSAFQTRRGSGGREGLEAGAGAWFEVAKLQALAARQIARELRLALRRLVGLGLLQRAGARPGQARRRLRLALGARPVALRRAARMPERFDRDLRAGQIDLPRGVRCALGDGDDHDERDRRARARDPRRRGGADGPLRAARAAARPSRSAPATCSAAERAIVQRRFGGSREQYVAALAPRPRDAGARARRDRRRAAAARRCSAGCAAPTPTAAEVAEFAADVRVRAGPRVQSPGAVVAPGRPRRALALDAPPQVFRAARPASRSAPSRASHAARARRHAPLAPSRRRARPRSARAPAAARADATRPGRRAAGDGARRDPLHPRPSADDRRGRRSRAGCRSCAPGRGQASGRRRRPRHRRVPLPAPLAR